MVMAGQTKFTVDVQTATSMIFFVSERSYEKFKEMEVFSEDENQLIAVKDCKAFEEMGSPASFRTCILPCVFCRKWQIMKREKKHRNIMKKVKSF